LHIKISLLLAKYTWTEGEDILGKQKSKTDKSSSTMSGKIDFKSKLYRDKEGHCIMAKMMSIQKEKITVTDMCFHAGTPHYIKQTLLNLKGEADSNTIMSGTSHPTFINV
jgi:hypothetical protein